MPHPQIAVHLKPYRGVDQAKQIQFNKRTRAAQLLETYLGENLCPDEAKTFNYSDLAVATGLSKELIRELLMPIGGGNNGITLRGEGEKAK